MSVTKPKLELSTRLAIRLENEHRGFAELIDELVPYVKANPDDKWAVGQLRYARKRVKRIEQQLGLAKNRKARPVS